MELKTSEKVTRFEIVLSWWTCLPQLLVSRTRSTKSDRQLDANGVACVTAKRFAGLHTAVNQAFKIIKRKEKEQKGKQIRRPSVMVYDRTSSLCDIEVLNNSGYSGGM